MRQGPNGRRPRGRHHGGGHGGGHGGVHGGGQHSSGNGNGNGAPPNTLNTVNRPRSAAALRHQTFDSHCLDMRVRGNAWQVYEKYQALARDATSSGDRVAAENYLQHAEHYYRIIEAINDATTLEQRQRTGGNPPSPFGDQPTVPANYFSPEGNLALPPGAPGQPADASNGAAVVSAGSPPAQAEVQRASPNPFFTPDETDEQAGNSEPLAARR